MFRCLIKWMSKAVWYAHWILPAKMYIARKQTCNASWKKCDIWESTAKHVCKVCHDCSTYAKSFTPKGNLCLTMMLLYFHLNANVDIILFLGLSVISKLQMAPKMHALLLTTTPLSIWRTVINCLPDKNRRRIY